MWRMFIILLVAFSSFKGFSQTVIEMGHPLDANVVLLEVDSPEKADLVVYKSNDKSEIEEYDCKWKFKAWGFSNFSVYITKDENDELLMDEETGRKREINGKVYFTEDLAQAGYKKPNFRLEGVFRKVASNDTEE
jgi:hypothetical protein